MLDLLVEIMLQPKDDTITTKPLEVQMNEIKPKEYKEEVRTFERPEEDNPKNYNIPPEAIKEFYRNHDGKVTEEEKKDFMKEDIDEILSHYNIEKRDSFPDKFSDKAGTLIFAYNWDDKNTRMSSIKFRAHAEFFKDKMDFIYIEGTENLPDSINIKETGYVLLSKYDIHEGEKPEDGKEQKIIDHSNSIVDKTEDIERDIENERERWIKPNVFYMQNNIFKDSYARFEGGDELINKAMIYDLKKDLFLAPMENHNFK
ncbi:MAG: hypothetical protein ACQEP1_04660 [Nanobdellota archaeon]